MKMYQSIHPGLVVNVGGLLRQILRSQQLKPVFSEQRKLKGRALKLRHEVPHVLLATEKVTQKYLCSRSLKSLMAPIGSHTHMIQLSIMPSTPTTPTTQHRL